jgi:hypothetical protein
MVNGTWRTPHGIEFRGKDGVLYRTTDEWGGVEVVPWQTVVIKDKYDPNGLNYTWVPVEYRRDKLNPWLYPGWELTHGQTKLDWIGRNRTFRRPWYNRWQVDRGHWEDTIGTAYYDPKDHTYKLVKRGRLGFGTRAVPVTWDELPEDQQEAITRWQQQHLK